MMSSSWYNSYIMSNNPINGEHMGMNTKTIKVKEAKRDFSTSTTPQERYMENVERGYTTTGLTAVSVKEEVIGGKRYKVISL